MAVEDAILLNILEMTSNLGPAAEEAFSIFRVPTHIRRYKNNDRYFEPRVVSVGPYHRNKDHLSGMEMHKWRYLNEFIENGVCPREEYVEKIISLLPSIRKCYFESINDLADDDFVQMLLLDGCYILQFLIKFNEPKNRHDPVFGVDWNLPLISTDLLMLENQIPFSVLRNLYELYSYTEPSETPRPSLDVLLVNFVKRLEHRSQDEVEINFLKWFMNTIATPETGTWEDRIHHLLHFYYIAYIPDLEPSSNSQMGTSIIPKALSFFQPFTSCLPGENLHSEGAHLPSEIDHPSRVDTHTLEDNRSLGEPQTSEEYYDMEEVPSQENSSPLEITDLSEIIRPYKERISMLESRRLKKASSSEQPSYPRMIPCATELQEFGITFRKHEKPKNFMDISFVRGVLRIPLISIEEATKAKYMNFVAFEQSSGMQNKHMTSYILFMDFLLNSGKDVIVLQRGNIIENKLANEDEVTEFFSQLNGCCYMKFDKHYLAPMFRDITAYCEAFWPKHRAKLYHDYFSNPWSIFSLCAALLVLGITVFRTVCFILSAFFHYDLS